MILTSKQVASLTFLIALTFLIWRLPLVAASPLCVIPPFLFFTAFSYSLKEYKCSKAQIPQKVTKLLFVLYSLWALLNAFVYTERFFLSLKSTIMTYSPKWFLLTSIAIAAIFLLTRKRPLKTVARMSEIIFPLFCGAVVLFLIMVLPSLSVKNVRQAFELGSIFDFEAITAITASVGVIFIPILFDSKKAEFSFSKALRYAGVFFFIAALYLTAFMLLPKLLTSSFFSLYSLSQAVNILGVLERPEGVAVAEGSMLMAISALFFISLFCYLTNNVTGRKTRAFSAVVFVIMCSVSLIARPDINTLFAIEKALIFINIIFEYFIPLVLMLTSVIINIKEKPKNADSFY